MISDTEEMIKENSWLKLGSPVNRKVKTAATAFRLANLNFEVIKKPLSVIISEDKSVIIPEQYATVRTDNNQILGLVGDRYTILQNKDAFSYFDPIIAQGIAEYESVGSFGNGQRIFANAILRKPLFIGTYNAEETIQLNVFMTNSHDAAGGASLLINPVRVATNTSLTGALSGENNSNRITFRHTSGVRENIQYTEDILEKIALYQNKLREIFTKMIVTKADEKTYEKVIVTSLADNSGMIADYYSTNPSKRFVGIVERVLDFAHYHPTQNTPTTKDTVFGAYNAIAGYNQLVHEWKSDDEKVRHIVDGGARLSLRVQRSFDECMKLIK